MPPSSAFSPPASIEGYQIGRLLRESGALVVHAGTSRLDLPVEASFARVSELKGGFEVDDFLAGVRRAAAVHHEALLPFVTGGRDKLPPTAPTWPPADLERPAAERPDGLEFVYAIAKSAEGSTLEETVAKDGPLSEKKALLVARAVAGVLSALEKNGMRHGDLGPSRVIFAAVDTVVVAPPRLLPASLVPRDERWQAPEEARGGENGVQSDLFVLGLLLLYALTGAHPAALAPDLRRALRDWKAPDLAASLRRVGPETRALVAKLTAPEPMNRPASAADALRAVEEALHPPETAPISIVEAAPIPTPAPPPARAAEPPKPRPSGRLYVESRLGEALLELEDDGAHLGPGPSQTVRAQAESFPEAALKFERTPTADVVRAAKGELKIDGAPAASPHELADGEKVEAAGIAARYERVAPPKAAGRAQRETAPAPKNPVAAVVTAAAVLGTAAAISWAVLAATGAGKAPAEAKSIAARASSRLDEDKTVYAPPPAPKETPATTGASVERAARDAYEAAKKNARRRPKEARGGYFETWQRYPETAYGLLARLEALAIERAQRPPVDRGLEEILAAAEADGGVVDEDMLNKMRDYAQDHAGTLSGERAHVALMKAQALANGRFDADLAAIRAAMAKKDWREALDGIERVMAYASRLQRQLVWTEKEKVQAAMSETLAESPGGRPTPGGGDGSKPPGPGGGADKDKTADGLFRNAKRLMDGGKEAEALEGFLEFLREGRGTPTYAKYEMEARARVGTLSLGPAGIVKLFKGKVDRLEKNRWRVTYDFQDAQQIEDFRDVNAFEAPPRAIWKIEGGAVKCVRGSGALVLDAVFAPADVATSIVATPDKPHDMGVLYMDPTEQKRFYLFTLQNTFFTLGNGPDPKPFLENAIVLFGPNMWRDTLPGKLGFVRKCGSDEPAVRPNEPTPVRVGKNDDEVWMKFEGGRSIRGSAFGDMKYSFPGIMPGLFVINSGGWFDDFVVEGTPDADWMKKRWETILSKL